MLKFLNLTWKNIKSNCIIIFGVVCDGKAFYKNTWTSWERTGTRSSDLSKLDGCPYTSAVTRR